MSERAEGNKSDVTTSSRKTKLARLVVCSGLGIGAAFLIKDVVMPSSGEIKRDQQHAESCLANLGSVAVITQTPPAGCTFDKSRLQVTPNDDGTVSYTLPSHDTYEKDNGDVLHPDRMSALTIFDNYLAPAATGTAVAGTVALLMGAADLVERLNRQQNATRDVELPPA